MRKMLLILLLCVSVVAAQVMTFFQKRIPTPSTLMTGLLEHWDLNEESGSRAGYFAHDLTDVNTVLYGTGKYGNAADFESTNDENLSCADDDSLSFSSTFTIAGWIKQESNSKEFAIAAKAAGTSANKIEYILGAYGSLTKYDFTVGNGVGITNIQSDTSTVSGRWMLLVGWYNATTDSIYIRVNNGGIKRKLSNPDVADGARNFYIGSWSDVAYDADGLIDLVSIWNRCPQASNGYAMSDSVWNNGNGWRPGL